MAGFCLGLCTAFLLEAAVLSTVCDGWAGETQQLNREDRLIELRAKAQERIEQDRALYSAQAWQDIESRYRSAHQIDIPMFLRPDALPILRELIARYPKSNYAGCAIVELAQRSAGSTREKYLQEAIASHSEAWFESGVQVGALARALLAVHYAGQGRLDEAERLATELKERFPGAIDASGASLDDVLEGVKLLRHPR